MYNPRSGSMPSAAGARRRSRSRRRHWNSHRRGPLMTWVGLVELATNRTVGGARHTARRCRGCRRGKGAPGELELKYSDSRSGDASEQFLHPPASPTTASCECASQPWTLASTCSRTPPQSPSAAQMSMVAWTLTPSPERLTHGHLTIRWAEFVRHAPCTVLTPSSAVPPRGLRPPSASWDPCDAVPLSLLLPVRTASTSTLLFSFSLVLFPPAQGAPLLRPTVRLNHEQ